MAMKRAPGMRAASAGPVSTAAGGRPLFRSGLVARLAGVTQGFAAGAETFFGGPVALHDAGAAREFLALFNPVPDNVPHASLKSTPIGRHRRPHAIRNLVK